MARIRSIKPEFATDETLGRCSRDARLLFVCLWTVADDWGRFHAAPEVLRGRLYPYDGDVTASMVAEWLKELDDSGRIRCYETESGRYGEVVNWTRHQRVDNAGRSYFPSPQFSANGGESQRDDADDGDSLSDSNLGQQASESHSSLPSPNLAASLGDPPLGPQGALGSQGSQRPQKRPLAESALRADTVSGADAEAKDVEEAESNREVRKNAALELLGRHDLAAAEARGQKIVSRKGLLRKLIADRDELDGKTLFRLQIEHPGWTAKRLAESVLGANAGIGTTPARLPEFEPEGHGQGVPPPPHLLAQMRRALKRVDDAIDGAIDPDPNFDPDNPRGETVKLDPNFVEDDDD
jgi:hypothetical protein